MEDNAAVETCAYTVVGIHHMHVHKKMAEQIVVNFMVRSLYWELCRPLINELDKRNLNRVYKILPLGSVLSHLNPVHIYMSCFANDYVTLIYHLCSSISL